MMEIKEKTPVIHVPRYVQEQMLENHQMWCPSTQFIGNDREIIQQMLDLAMDFPNDWAPLSELLNSLVAVGSIELGLVSSWNAACVFVKYHPQLHRIGWGYTSQGSFKENLFKRRYITEDRGFLDVPEYPELDPVRHEYVLSTAGSDGWTPVSKLMIAISRDRADAANNTGSDDEADSILAIPWHEWIDSLYVYAEDASGHPEGVAEFNLDTWEWESTPGVQEKANG